MDKLRAVATFYYCLKPLVPRSVQVWVRSELVRKKRRSYTNAWPILEKAARPPDDWSGWPDKKQFALVLTHDVETSRGQEKVYDVIKLEKDLGFRSSFNFVPERYEVSEQLRQHIVQDGFEIGVHGLFHDGKLYRSREIFRRRASRINNYLRDWNCVGFRSPSMHHNLDWIHALKIEYDASTFDTDPFEPQPDGVGTIFPFLVRENSIQNVYVELPYTLPQDFTLFILMKERNIGIWKRKLDWIVQKGGMALLNTHPDYMSLLGKKPHIGEYPARYYEEFLQYIRQKYQHLCWHVLPQDIARFWFLHFADKEFGEVLSWDKTDESSK